ncbi:MAG: DUF1003 domain-containing protein [Candidatus Buchananbacteria bacterium]
MKRYHKRLRDLKSVKEINDVNREHYNRLSPLDKLAIFITERVGTIGFFLVIFCWTFCWLTWNIFAPNAWRFDSFPAFVLWLFISNMIQIMLLPLIMVGQNLQAHHAEIRAESDFRVNVKAEREIKRVINHLQDQNKILLKMVKYLEKEDK